MAMATKCEYLNGNDCAECEVCIICGETEERNEELPIGYCKYLQTGECTDDSRCGCNCPMGNC